jgi:hypothetical protein
MTHRVKLKKPEWTKDAQGLAYFQASVRTDSGAHALHYVAVTGVNTMTHFKRFSVSIVISAVLASTLAFAADEAVDHPLYVGALIGANLPNGNSGSSVSPTFGATVGAKIAPSFGIGAFGTYYGQSNSGSFLGLPTGTSTRTFNVAGEANFFASGFHIGGDIGAAFTSATGNIASASVSSSDNALIYGPEAGFDFPLAPGLTLGGEAHYLFNNSNNSQNNLLLLGALKIWL